MSMPEQNKTTSKQDYETPRPFLDACEARFGPIVADLACHESNTKFETGLVWPETNSLSEDWAARFPTKNLWLNPPFKRIDPWAAKSAFESARRLGFILMLSPASVASEWFAEHVLGKAMVLALRPRLQFEGMLPNPKTGKVDGYPKDLMLSVFGHGLHGFDSWRWK